VRKVAVGERWYEHDARYIQGYDTAEYSFYWKKIQLSLLAVVVVVVAAAAAAAVVVVVNVPYFYEGRDLPVARHLLTIYFTSEVCLFVCFPAVTTHCFDVAPRYLRKVVRP
jgi:hypothetical protein